MPDQEESFAAIVEGQFDPIDADWMNLASRCPEIAPDSRLATEMLAVERAIQQGHHQTLSAETQDEQRCARDAMHTSQARRILMLQMYDDINYLLVRHPQTVTYAEAVTHSIDHNAADAELTEVQPGVPRDELVRFVEAIGKLYAAESDQHFDNAKRNP